VTGTASGTASEETELLELEDLVVLMRRLGAGPMRDVGLLEAACARSRASVFGADAYPTLAGKAAALLHSIVANDALVDGNERLGWLATVVFLDVNGWDVMLDDESAFRLVMDVAEGTLDVEAMAGILEAALSPTPTPEP
jgi:death on curing protein